jgi:3-deoxy-D-manno-octulosonate 8-phosphate phosphatase (KDO 8-P phosphatase)
MIAPAIAFPAELLLRAQPVRLVILDVDGVLTDGGLYFSEQGESIKRFSVLDGQGIKMLQRAGILLAVITGRDSAALRNRLHALNIQHAVFGTEDKLPAAKRLLTELALPWQQVAVMGDDWPDLPMLRLAQLACAPANAHVENRAIAHFVSHSRGGEGAVRELCDLILTARGHYARFFEAALGQ